MGKLQQLCSRPWGLRLPFMRYASRWLTLRRRRAGFIGNSLGSLCPGIGQFGDVFIRGRSRRQRLFDTRDVELVAHDSGTWISLRRKMAFRKAQGTPALVSGALYPGYPT